MGQINLQINGRTHTVACDEGQEDHLRDLAEFVAKQAENLAGDLGHIADSRLLLMTALTIADELGEAMARVDEVQGELEALRAEKSSSEGSSARQESDELAQVLDRATQRVQAIAARVANA